MTPWPVLRRDNSPRIISGDDIRATCNAIGYTHRLSGSLNIDSQQQQ